MPKGDDKEVVQITRIEWNEFCDKLDKLSVSIDKIYVKLFGDPTLGEDGMYEEHKKMWEFYKENKWWKNKTTAVLSTLGGVLGIISVVISIILNAGKL